MCSVKCPVNINTGRMVKELRANQVEAGSAETRMVNLAAQYFGVLMGGLPAVLVLVGPRRMCISIYRSVYRSIYLSIYLYMIYIYMSI